MAAKVQLDIESRANTQALKQAIADLEKLGMAGKSTNQVFRQTNDLEGYKAALVKSYETARTFGDQMKATRTAFSDTNKAIKAAQAYLGENKNNMFTFIDEKGMQQQTRDMDVIEKQIRGFLGNVVADTQNFQQSMTRKLGEFEGFDSFKGKLQTTADAYKLMGNELGGVQYKMTAIQQQILDMSTSHGDPKEIQKLATEYKKLTKEHEELAKAQNGTSTRIKNLIKNFVSAQLIVWALRSVVSGLTKGLKEASTAAAEAEQTFGRFDAVFEGLERANSAIDNLVDNFGVANSSAADILSSIGNTAIGFGASAIEAAKFSETVASSLSDIMAFRDVQGSISDFAQRFMSGASGNVENFRAIGSIVRQSMVDLELQKQGWENLTGQALEWAKVQARVNIVMEQQRKAMGATEREWDSMLSLQRRHQEANKQLKENIGETVNQFIKPLSQWWLQIKENINDATQAQKNFEKGMPSRAPIIDIETDEGKDRAKKLLMGLLSKQVGTYTLFGKTYGIDVDMITAVADAFGITSEQVAKIALDQDTITDEMWEQLRIHDKMTASARAYAKAESDRLANIEAAKKAYEEFLADIGAGMGLGRSALMTDVTDYIGKDAGEFVSPLERLLGFEGGYEAELEAKIKKLSELVTTTYNASISGATEDIRSEASKMLDIFSDALAETQKVKAAMQSAAEYDKVKSGIEDELATMQKRNELEAQYGKENDDIVTIKLQQWEAEREALELFKERLSATGKGKESYQEYLDLMELISKQYGLQLGLAEDIAKAAKDAAMEQAKASATDMFTSASRELSYLGDNGDALKRQDEINDKLEEYTKHLTDSGMSLEDVAEAAQKYRAILVKINETTESNKAKELADSLLESYQDRNASLTEELEMMKYRATLEGQYSEEEQGIVDLMVQKRQQEADALSFMQKQIDAKMDATLAEKEYEAELLLINDIHQMNLDLLLDQIQAAKELKAEQAKNSAEEMFTAANREVAYLGPNGDSLRQQDEMNDKIAQYEQYLKDANYTAEEQVDLKKAYIDLLKEEARIIEANKASELADSLLQSYSDRNASLSEELGLMLYRASIEGQFAEDEQGILDLMVQREKKEADALAFRDKQVEKGMDAVEAEVQYQIELNKIATIHNLNLGLLQDQIEAARTLAREQAGESAQEMFTAATRELSYLGPNGDALEQQDTINDKVEQYIDYLSKTEISISDVITKAKEYRDLLEEIAEIEGKNADQKTAEDFTKSYQDRVDTLRQSYESLKLSSDLEKQYGSERASVEQKHVEALQEAWRYMSEQVKLGMDATEANEMYLDSAKAITAEYQLQLDLLEEQERVKRSEALESATKAIAGVIGQRALVGASDAQKTQARIDEQVYAFAEELTQGGAKLKETLDQTAEYRRQLEMLAAEEARQAVWDGIKSQWEGTGDVGMISGWVDAFKDGGPMAGIAKVATDLLTSFESVNDLLSIVTKFIEYVSPAVDQFLAPLMPVLEMILSTIADLLLPVLQILFPVIQGLSVVLIYLHAVVKTVTNALSWLVDTIVTAIWNIAHPFRQRAFRSLGDETVAIWEDANAKVEKIWNMELDTRLEFVGKLTDAQQGQLDAYNEMFKAGLLTLTQYNAMVGKNVYGKNFDNVDIASFASGGNFITNGEQIIRVGEAGREHVQITPLNSTGYANRNVQQVGGNSYSVVVNGANGDPEEIAMAVRQEFKRMERRGVRYA
jgi:hypothetical protein